jgi:hypothetical protein
MFWQQQKKHREGALKPIIVSKQSSLCFPNTGGIPVPGDTIQDPLGARR